MLRKKKSFNKFIDAALDGKLDVVQKYIAEITKNKNKNDVAAAINTTTAHGSTALICAAHNGHAAIVTALLAVPGIDSNAANQYGETALICAAHKGYAAIVTALLAVPGIDSNATGSDGNTALIWAANNGHAAIVTALLAVPGIAINAANQDGDTALIWAAAKGHAAIVIALLDARADITIKNKEGKTAEVLAKDEAIRYVIKSSTAEKKLEAFENVREATVNKYNLVDEAQKTAEQTKEEQEAMQKLADLSFIEISRSMKFLQDNLHKIDLTLLKDVTFDFANLVACLGKDYEGLSHDVYAGAASMGHEKAAHIVESFQDVRKTDEMQSSAATAPASTHGLFGMSQDTNNSQLVVVAREEKKADEDKMDVGAKSPVKEENPANSFQASKPPKKHS